MKPNAFDAGPNGEIDGVWVQSHRRDDNGDGEYYWLDLSIVPFPNKKAMKARAKAAGKV